MKNKDGRFVVAHPKNHAMRIRDIFGTDHTPKDANGVWDSETYHIFTYLNGAQHIAEITDGTVIDLNEEIKLSNKVKYILHKDSHSYSREKHPTILYSEKENCQMLCTKDNWAKAGR